MSYQKKILVFTATYNEAENIYELISLIKTQPSNPHVLIIDDNSPDGTSDKVVKSQSKFKDIFLIKRNKKLGLDTAHKEAYNFAIKNNYDYFITMDADFSHDPNEIKNFLKNLEHFPFVIGSRYMEGGKCLMKRRRLFMSKYGNKMIRFFLKIDCTEYTSSFRGFNLKALNNFSLDIVKTKGYSFFMGTIFEVNQKKFKIKQIPIIFKDRSKGYSKIPKLEIFRTLFNLIKLKLRNV
jgi:dolichol-phosphate mannosyltransferase